MHDSPCVLILYKWVWYLPNSVFQYQITFTTNSSSFNLPPTAVTSSLMQDSPCVLILYKWVWYFCTISRLVTTPLPSVPPPAAVTYILIHDPPCVLILYEWVCLFLPEVTPAAAPQPGGTGGAGGVAGLAGEKNIIFIMFEFHNGRKHGRLTLGQTRW